MTTYIFTDEQILGLLNGLNAAQAKTFQQLIAAKEWGESEFKDMYIQNCERDIKMLADGYSGLLLQDIANRLLERLEVLLRPENTLTS